MHLIILRRALRTLAVLRPILVASLGGLSLLSAATAAEGGKSYTLFEGNNIAVGQGKEVYQVRDVSGGSWVIVVDGKEVLVSAKSGPINMKVTPVTKLSDISVTLAKLKAERGYTYLNDPVVKLTRAMNQAASTNAGYQAASNQATAAQSPAAAVSTSTNSGGSGAASTAINAALAAQAAHPGPAGANGPGLDQIGRGVNDAEGDFDALDVSFEISSPTPLRAPYLVTMTRIHEPGSPAGSFRNVMFAKAIEPVTTQAAKVQFQQVGFPFGYQLEGYEIHVYDGGREVATNLSPKRQVLTLDQAFDYVRTKYVEAHRTGTLPAIPVMGDLPHDFAAQVATGKYPTSVYAKVSKEGLANEVFSDPDCKTKMADPFLETVVRGIRFEPALDAGNPVDGVVSLNLSKLRM